MLKTVAAIRAHAGDAFAINACGGVFTGQDAIRALQAGATTVQLYTGLVYQGPRVVRKDLQGAGDRLRPLRHPHRRMSETSPGASVL